MTYYINHESKREREFTLKDGRFCVRTPIFTTRQLENEVNHFLYHDAPKLLDILGNDPVLLAQTPENDPFVYIIRQTNAITKARKLGLPDEAGKGLISQERIMVAYLLETAEFYITRKRFSVSIAEIHAPIFLIDESGKINNMAPTIAGNDILIWNGPALDDLLFNSLKREVADKTYRNRIELDTKTGPIRIYKQSSEIAISIQKYLSEQSR